MCVCKGAKGAIGAELRYEDGSREIRKGGEFETRGQKLKADVSIHSPRSEELEIRPRLRPGEGAI
jgi:hypothetical protein